jgi:hypothetical protein
MGPRNSGPPIPSRKTCDYITSVMAEIVLSIGTSHSPMIGMDYAAFPGLAARDRGRLYVAYDLISRAPR